MSAGFCTCEVPSPHLIEGVRTCAECGGQLAEARDRLLVLIARQQRKIIDRLERLELPEPARNDALLSPAELARKLGRSPSFIYDHADELGGIRIGRGAKPRIWFDLALARECLASLAAANGAKPEPASQPHRKRRPRRTDVDLLPVRGAKR